MCLTLLLQLELNVGLDCERKMILLQKMLTLHRLPKTPSRCQVVIAGEAAEHDCLGGKRMET